MGTIDRLKNAALFAVDSAMYLYPRPTPARDRLKACRLVSHRGDHDCGHGPIRENTLPAFERAINGGAWGVEFDVRWTADQIPVVHHDKETERVFGSQNNLRIARVTLEELRKSHPAIPTLEETLQCLKGRAHAMIEIKRPGLRKKITAPMLDSLSQTLKMLTSETDFHLISLDPKLLLQCEFVSRKALLPIAELDIFELSRVALREKMGGLTGQYALFTNDLVQRHHAAGQLVGTGFAASRSVLFRELSRGVDWIFTNHAAKRALDLKLTLAGQE